MMECRIKKIILFFALFFLSGSFSLLFAKVDLPAGFEEVYYSKNNGVFNIIYEDRSIGTMAVEYDRQEITLLSPGIVAEHILFSNNTELILSKEKLLEKLSQPLKRVEKNSFSNDSIMAYLREQDSSLQIIMPSSFFTASEKLKNSDAFIKYQNSAGFIHGHNMNYLKDSYGDSLSISSTETLSFTGNSYLNNSWNYSGSSGFTLDELAFYLENKSTRFKVGRQRLSENLNTSTPSVRYSFFSPVNFDGVSLGYMADNYLISPSGAASPVSVYMPQAGMVEVYQNGRLIDLQQFTAGLHYMDTQSWPGGAYDVLLVSKLMNGTREENVQPFFKRRGSFRSGEVEYLIQLGRYEQTQRSVYIARNSDPVNINGSSDFAGFSLGYTTNSAFSLGGGILADDQKYYLNTSLDFVVNSPLIERLQLDSVYGVDGSTGYQIGAFKSFQRMGFNASYRDNRFKGDKKDFLNFGIIPSYDYQNFQIGANTFLPWNIGLNVNYSLNKIFYDYDRKDRSKFASWNVNLSRDFALPNSMSLRMDMGINKGVGQIIKDKSVSRENEKQLFLQMSLAMHEKSYNHNQSLYLRSRLNNEANNNYSADYTTYISNPDFDRTGKYIVNATVANEARQANSASLGMSADNRLGYTSVGMTQNFGLSSYNQLYLSQRSGFAIGSGEIAFGRVENNSALIIDARELPAGQHFEIQNRSMESIVIEGGSKSILSVPAYQKVSPKAEQIFTGKANTFYNLNTQFPSLWSMPGQVHYMKVTATKNQTVTGRIYFDGQPMANARIIGGNAVSDEEGLFVGDFTLKINEDLKELKVRKEERDYFCPLSEGNIKMIQGVMQIREANCEIQ